MSDAATQTPQPPHPSFFALDRLRLGDDDHALRGHVAGCSRCRAYVDADADAVAGPRPLSAPAWLSGVTLRPIPRPHVTRARRLPAWLFLPSLAAVAAAAALWLVVRPTLRLGDSPAADPFAGIRAKGPPSVVVFVKRDGRVLPWDGSFSLRAGDALRLQVAASAYSRVSVASVAADAGAPEVLYDGALDGERPTLLPVSFRVDQRGQREVLSLVLSRRTIAPADHRQGGTPAEEQQSWRQILVFDKE
jgi:hypothetical protein